MTKHSRQKKNLSAHHAKYKSEGIQFHKDWRVWLGVGIMLLAMLIYVVTVDESILPSIMGQ
jgi:hypothetical protein